MKTFRNLIHDETMKIVEKINILLSEKMFPSFDPVIIIVDLYEKTYKYQLKIIESELKRYYWKYEYRQIPTYELNCCCDKGIYTTNEKEVYNKKKDIIGIELKISIDEEEFSNMFIT